MKQFFVMVIISSLLFSGVNLADAEPSVNKGFRIGQPLTLFLIDSNLNLDSDKAETYSLDLIKFRSEKIQTTMGPKGGVQDAFNPRPSALRETGDNTGIFYTVIEIPRSINGKVIGFGEKIEFEYTQRGLGGFLKVVKGTPISDKQKESSNGKLSVDSKSFRAGQPVTITLNDPDLNQRHDVIDIYHVINDQTSPHVDTVGTKNGGILLEVKIKDIRYKRCTINGVEHGGLASTGFTLVETDPSSGIFKGLFKIPSEICDKNGTKLIPTAGGNISLVYHDFRDSFGEKNIRTV